jgi:hypothetical protein
LSEIAAQPEAQGDDHGIISLLLVGASSRGRSETHRARSTTKPQPSEQYAQARAANARVLKQLNLETVVMSDHRMKEITRMADHQTLKNSIQQQRTNRLASPDPEPLTYIKFKQEEELPDPKNNLHLIFNAKDQTTNILRGPKY